MRVTLPKQPMKPVWNQFSHSKWDLVWYSGGSLGLEMQWKGGAGRLGRFVFLFTLMPAHSFSPTSEFTGSSIEVKCKPEKKYKQACEKRTSKPVKSPYGVGHYCDIAVSPTRSHLLWVQQNRQQGLRAYCPKKYTVMHSHLTPSSFLKKCG